MDAWMDIGFPVTSSSCGCPTSPPPPPPVPVTCVGVPHDAPETLTLTVPDGPDTGCNAGQCQYPINIPFTAGCCNTGVNASGTFSYGSPPAGTGSAFAAGYQAWFDPTLFESDSNEASGCHGSGKKWYRYIYYNTTTCAFYCAEVYSQDTSGTGTWSAWTTGPNNGNFSGYWPMNNGVNTWSPFLATSGSSPCVATLSG